MDDSIFKPVDPAVDPDVLAAIPCVPEYRSVRKMAGLGQHVELAQSVGGGLCWQRVDFITMRAAQRADAGQPVLIMPPGSAMIGG